MYVTAAAAGGGGSGGANADVVLGLLMSWVAM